jgi:hypothetical protein
MADNTGNEAKKNLKEINEIVKAIDSGFSSLSNNLQDITNDLKNTTGQARVFNSIQKDINNSITQISRNNEKLIKNQIALNNGQLSSKIISKQIQEITAAREVLELRLNRLQDQQNNGIALTKKQKQEIKKLEEQLSESSQEVLSNYQGQLDQVKKIETKLGIFGRLTKGLTKIPLVGDLLDAEGALEAMNKSALEGKSLFKNLGAGISAAFKGIESASVVLAIFSAAQSFAKFFVSAMFTADERTTNIAKNLGLSKDEASGVYSNLTKLNGTLKAELDITKNIAEAFNDLAGITEFTIIATDKQIDAQIILTKEIGLSKEAALGFQESLAVSNIEATKGVDIVYDQIAAFANQNKIVADGRKIFDQINKTSKLIQLNFKGNIPLLTKTILEANKLGLSLEQVDKIAGSLLDFESSISAELEAELLTGRNINLERARLFALNNDIAGLTKEIANQGINAANFASMNRIQQEAIAKALGMSASELGDSLYKQELITKTAGNYTTKLKEEAKILKDSNDSRKIAKGLALEQQAIAIENGLLQGKTIEEAQRSLTAQEKFNTAIELAKELFSDLATGGYLDSLANGVKALVSGFRLLGGIIDTIIVKPLNILANTISGILKILAGGISGLITGNYDLAKSGFTSDLAFAGANIADMAINTGVGLGVDKKYKNMFTKPMLDEQAKIDAKEQSTAEDFISRPGQPIQKFRKDDVIIGGTSLGGGSDEEIKTLLKELVNAVKAGGNVYLDSNKVGTTMTMGTFKTQ